jgi:hypothetical protein
MRRAAIGFLAVVAGLVASAAPALASSGPQHFVIVATGPLGTPARITLSGPISGVGTSVDTETEGTVTVNGGTIHASHPVLTQNNTFNAASCTFKIDETGTYTLGEGTGRYTGVSGTGTYKTKGTIVFRHTANGCSAQPLVSIVTTRGTGVTTLPAGS